MTFGWPSKTYSKQSLADETERNLSKRVNKALLEEEFCKLKTANFGANLSIINKQLMDHTFHISLLQERPFQALRRIRSYVQSTKTMR